MDALSMFLDELKKSGHSKGNFLGFLNVLIGRRIERKGTLVAGGLTWRELAGLLKKHRWDPDAVRELGIDPDQLPPRDRQRYWYTAITQSAVDSTAASAAGEKFAETLRGMGYTVSGAPGR
jgi:hypothetical protein